MGIKTLNPFLREKCPNAFRDIPYSFFRGKRIGIDADNVLRKLISRAHKEIVNETDVCTVMPDRKKILAQAIYHLREEILKFLRFGISLIFIFDGKYIDEKSETQNKRKEIRVKRIDEAEKLKENILSVEELERTPNMLKELRKKMEHLGSNLQTEEKDFLIRFLKSSGFPVLTAKEEGEKLCAMLCLEGYIEAVYSKDTDLIAMGCPISFGEDAGWIYNAETKKSEMALKCCVFEPILPALNMEYSTFLDLCIMAGCDFNTNIYRVGINTAYKLLHEYKSIDNLPEKYRDKISVLNHIRCREIFSRQKSITICSQLENTNVSTILNLNLNLNRDLVTEEEIETHLLSDWFNELKTYYSDRYRMPIPKNIVIEKLPILKRCTLKIINNETNETNEIKESDDKNDEKSDIEIVKQKASPKKLTMTMINDLNNQQLKKYREKNNSKDIGEIKKIKLKIIQ